MRRPAAARARPDTNAATLAPLALPNLSRNRKITGVVYSVSSWLTSRPPTMVIPRGCRNSEPSPVPKASGSAPNRAAIVVIMIGRKRNRQACVIASRVSRPWRSACEREVDHHDRVLLDDADQQNDADEGDDRHLHVEHLERQQRADARRGQGRDDGDRMDVALVENAEHEIDRQQRRADQQQSARTAPAARRAPCRRRRRARWTACRCRWTACRRSRLCASLIALPGARLNEIVAAANWP